MALRFCSGSVVAPDERISQMTLSAVLFSRRAVFIFSFKAASLGPYRASVAGVARFVKCF